MENTDKLVNICILASVPVAAGYYVSLWFEAPYPAFARPRTSRCSVEKCTLHVDPVLRAVCRCSVKRKMPIFWPLFMTPQILAPKTIPGRCGEIGIAYSYCIPVRRILLQMKIGIV